MRTWLVLVLTFCLLMGTVACTEDGSHNEGDYGTLEYPGEEEPFEKDRMEPDDTLYEDVHPSAKACRAFIDYLKAVEVPYRYSSYYQLDQAWIAYTGRPSQQDVSHGSVLETLTAEALLARVKTNNAAYKAAMPSYSAAFYEEFDEGALRRYCTYVIEGVQAYLATNKVEDPARVKCVLGDLKVFGKSMMTNAYVSDDNCLMISPGMIETMEIKNTAGTINVERAIIVHEAMHMLQKNCAHASSDVYRIGHSYKFDGMTIHPLFHTWFYEGAAERMVNNVTGYPPLTYEYYIGYINSMTLSAVLEQKNELYGVEESTLSASLDPLFAYFSCTTESEKKELLNLLFSLEIVETDDAEFKAAIDTLMDEKELSAIKRELKNSICTTMTKYFYASLTRRLAEGAMPLNDVFYLITVFEQDMNTHILFTDREKREDAKELIDAYVAIQDRFFKLLAGDVYTQEEIIALFGEYGLVDAAGQRNATLGFVSAEKQRFIETLLTRVYTNSFAAIRRCIP